MQEIRNLLVSKRDDLDKVVSQLLEAEKAIKEAIPKAMAKLEKLDDTIKLIDGNDEELIAALSVAQRALSYVTEDTIVKASNLKTRRASEKPKESVNATVIPMKKVIPSPNTPYVKTTGNSDNIKLAEEVVKPFMDAVGRPVTVKEVSQYLEMKHPYLKEVWKNFHKGTSNVLQLMKLDVHHNVRPVTYSLKKAR